MNTQRLPGNPRAIDNVVMQTPCLDLGLHVFSYGSSEYDGLVHKHPEYSFVTCLEGNITIQLDNCFEVLEPGETYVVNAGVPHCCTFGEGGQLSKGLTVLVTQRLLSSFQGDFKLIFPDDALMPIFLGKLRDVDVIRSAQAIREESFRKQRGYGILTELIAKQVLAYALRAWPIDKIHWAAKPSTALLPWLFMHRTTEYMNSYGKGQFRLYNLCEDIGLSSSRFIPLFRNSAGLSPHTYYNQLLLLKADRLMQNKQRSTKETAFALGFKNVSHFCALYHKLKGSTPRDRHAETGH